MALTQAQLFTSRLNLGWSALLALSVVACSFETQPIFDSPAKVSQFDDSGTGQQTGAVRSDGGSTGTGTTPADAGPPKGTTPPVRTSPDAGPPVFPGDAANSCQPGATNMCLFGAAVVCNAQGTGFGFVSCAGLGCSADGKRCNDCAPGKNLCSDPSTLTMCGADGHTSSKQSCALGCSAATAATSAHCNACLPGSMTTCASATDVQRCRADGSGMEVVSCPDSCVNGACTTCSAGEVSCADADTLRTCDANGGSTTSHCDHGCDPINAQCTPGSLVPSNLPADTCADAADHSVEYSDNTSIDTDSDCSSVVQQTGDAPEICVIRYADLHVMPGVTVRANGSRVLALVATGSMNIEGTLMVGARGDLAGPGARTSGAGVGQSGSARGGDPMMGNANYLPANAGGGGGGHAVKGGAGGTAGACNMMDACALPGAGGTRFGLATLIPLQGGSSGGQNSGGRQPAAGGGGGALQLVSCGDLILGAAAIVDAAGGGGGGGLPDSNQGGNPTPGGGAGGGSGGAILIEALSLHVAQGAGLYANGGGGGGGASRASGMGMGMSDMSASAGDDGQDGRRSAAFAAGGSAGGAGSAPGGAGGTVGAPGAGGAVSSTDHAAGGGGGAAGFIHVAGPSAVDITGLASSPRLSAGTVTLN